MNRRKKASEARNKELNPSNAPLTRDGTKMTVPRSVATPLNHQQALGSASSRNSRPAVTSSSSYADAISGRRSRDTPLRAQSNSQSLFTLDECANLLFSAIEELQLCQSKLDQLKVLTGLLQKCVV